MSGKFAVGVGCRRGCEAELIEAIVRQALSRLSGAERPCLFTIADKRGEAGLVEAASRLDLELAFLPRAALREQAPLVRTRSMQSESLFGVPSVAEAAALAGAGPGSALIVPRIANQGATCAIAIAARSPL